MATIRFATGAPGGPHGSVWRLWTTSAGDVYIAGRSLAGKFKASLHASGRWRIAATKENVEGPDPLVDPLGDRAVHKWERPAEFAPGLTHACSIAIAGSDVDSPASKSSRGEVIWVPAPAAHEVGIFDVIYSRLPKAPNKWPGKDAMGARPVFDTPLPSGEILWVLVDPSPDAVFEREGRWRRWASQESNLVDIIEKAAKLVEAYSDEMVARLEVDFPDTGRGITRTDVEAFTRELASGFDRLGFLQPPPALRCGASRRLPGPIAWPHESDRLGAGSGDADCQRVRGCGQRWGQITQGYPGYGLRIRQRVAADGHRGDAPLRS